MRFFLHAKRLLPVFGVLLTILTSAQKSVLTQHNSIDRTGWYDNEKVLNKGNVRPGSFGEIFVRTVDDQIYAQPLVKLNLRLPNIGKKNVVFVATVNNTIYAFDADSANVTKPYWKVNLTPVHSRVISKNDVYGACGGFYNDFSGNMGIVGTPVIDSTTNTMYVVARSADTTTPAYTYNQYLHALDIKTGKEKAYSPVFITASVSGYGDGSAGGKVHFDGLHNNQRSGLLLVNGILYIAWSSHCDWGPYHGWLISYDKTTLKQKSVYATTPDGYNGGIWMSGGGPSADTLGNVYLAVGNGSVGKNGNPADLRNRSESALKLKASGSGFTIKSFFTPINYETLEGADLDFGVTQLMLIPKTNRAIVGVKDGHLYLLNRNDMGGYNASADNVIQSINLGSSSYLRSAMSYYKGKNKEFVYSWSENSLLRAYPYNRTTSQFDLNNTIISGIQGPTGNNGALLSVSSNGSSDTSAILWASYAANGDANQSVRPGILRAIDANDVTKELWNSSMSPYDNPGSYAKFNCPTIVNGKVYLATFSNQLVVYGLTGNSVDSCGNVNLALHKPVYASSLETTDYAAPYAVDGNLSTRWSSQYSDPQYIYVDLGQRYDLCRVVLHWEVALGQDFKIQVSDNGTTWTDAATITGNVSYDDYISVHSSGRYVRMYGTTRGTTYGYSLWEFEVYGKPVAKSCATPTGLYTTNVYDSSATLHWADQGVQKYNVQYKTVTAVNWNKVVTKKNQVILNDLSCNTPYLFRVQAVCDSVNKSDYSASAGFTTLQCNINCDPLPTRWSTQDIGNVGVSGSACYNSATGTFKIKGSGADISGEQDEFRFAYKTVVGNATIIARVVDLDSINKFNKCGIMVRETLGEGARNVLIDVTSGNGAVFRYRGVTDSATTNVKSVAGIKAPYWLKIVISGSTYTGYISSDGLTWTKMGSAVNANFGNGNPVYAGIAITSHDNTKLSTAHVDNYTISGGTLDLKLISFTGRLTLSKTIALDWTTTRETKTDYFIVERTKDFWNYQSIDTVIAENNGEFTQNYAASDINSGEGMNYYRLKIVGMDGKFNYSPIAAVKVVNNKSPLMYPNPSNNYVNITQGTELMKLVNVYNILGQPVARFSNTGKQEIIKLPVYSLPAGLYFVEIRTASAVYIEKLVVSK